MLETSIKENDCSVDKTLLPVCVLGSPRQTGLIITDSNLSVCKNRLDVIFKALQENYLKWCTLEKHGIKYCQSIESIKTRAIQLVKGSTVTDDESKFKAKEPTLYPQKLCQLCKELRLIVQQFRSISENACAAWKQATALCQLPGCKDQIIYRSWTMINIADFLFEINKHYHSELQIKQHIMENLAHCWCVHDLIRCTTAWEFPQFVDDNVKLMFAFIGEETSNRYSI